MLCLYVTSSGLLSALFFFFKQKTAYEMRISDWSSDVCSSDLHVRCHSRHPDRRGRHRPRDRRCDARRPRRPEGALRMGPPDRRPRRRAADRKSVVSGKSVSVRVDLGGRRILKKKTTYTHTYTSSPYSSITQTAHKPTHL